MKHRLLVCVLVVLSFTGASVVFSETETERKIRVTKWDKENLRYSTGVATDTSKELIKIPDGYPGKQDFVVAKKAPTVDFAPIRELNPEFFPEDNKGIWSQWGEVTKGPNGCFYMASGDHRCKNGQVFITEYDPVKKEQRIVVDVGKICGWKKNQLVHGKIHGRMDIMQDGTLVAATWNGSPIRQEWLDKGYIKGGYVLTYNVLTGVAEYHGIPFYGDSWPYHSIDTQTGVLMAVGAYNNFLSYDVRNKRLLYGGTPPDGIDWCRRATLLDERTGMLYSTDASTEDNQFVSYNQRTNEFRRLECSPPPHPVSGKKGSLRAYTARRTPDGIFYCMDQVGVMYKFNPDEEKTEYIGINWDAEGVYTTSVAMDSKFRYIYYVPGSHGRTMNLGTPVVQYDIKTGQKKVIAFLGPLYHEKYGYACTGTFGIELSEDDSLLVIQMNGGFGENPHKSMFENTAVFAVHIPESERPE
jgi:hypothetical protein